MASPIHTVLRQQHQHLRRRLAIPRRFASSTPPPPPPSPLEQAQKSAQTAFASVSKTAGSVFRVAQRAAGPLGERVGSLLGLYREPVVYNLSVAREFLKHVYRAERLAPPTSLHTWSSAYTTLAQRVRNPAYWRETVRNGEWARIGIYALEAYGIFKIGEIIGRRSLVGYKVQ